MARGWAHIGVIKALRRLGFEFDVITGCSVGALAGGCYLAGKLDALEDWALLAQQAQNRQLSRHAHALAAA